MQRRPPRCAVWLLRRMLVRQNRDFIIDDLTEEFRAKLRSGTGLIKAHAWFWRQVAESIGPSVRDRGFLPAGFRGVLQSVRDFTSDIRYAARSLAKNAGYASVALVTVALGIGANTAVFTVVNGVLLRPLGYPDEDRLVTLWSAHPEVGTRSPPSYPDFQAWRDQTQSFEEMAFIYGDDMVLKTDDGWDPVLAACVSRDFFSTLRGRLLLGNSLDAGAGDAVAERSIVLKYGTWQGRFGSDPEIVGKVLSFQDGPYTVVGVTDRSVSYPTWGQVWVPLTAEAIEREGLLARDRRIDTRVLGRLRRDASLSVAQAELATVAARLAAEHPETNADWTVNILSLKSIVLDPFAQNPNLSRSLYVLMGAVGLVLLIACANIANLMLARVLSRRREMAVRRALGAGRIRLVRQTLTESLVLAVVGAAGGLLVARWGIAGLLARAPQLPRLEGIRVDLGVLGFAAGITVLAALLFGVAPALRSWSADLASTLKEGSRGSLLRAGTKRLQVSLVISQVSLALVLLIGAGLLGESLRRLGHVDPGFNPKQLIGVRVRPPLSRYDSAPRRADLYRRVVDAVMAVPGVESAAFTNHTPGAGLIFSPLEFEGLEGEATTGFKTVTAGYFETMQMPVLQGRSFSEPDMTEWTGALIINEHLARFVGDALGKRITVFKMTGDVEFGEPISGEVVGVVGDTRVALSQEVPYANVYVPYTQNPWYHGILVARILPGAGAVGNQIRDAVLSVEPDIPGVEPWSIDTQVQRTVSRERFAAILMGTFAAAALLLASVGIYGVMSYLVRQRTAEIGLRMALGATGGRVLRLVVGRAMWMVALGAAIGLGGALALTRFMSALLFGVSATDPATYVSVTTLLLLVAFGASYLPARQATRVDPLRTLRVD